MSSYLGIICLQGRRLGMKLSAENRNETFFWKFTFFRYHRNNITSSERHFQKPSSSSNGVVIHNRKVKVEIKTLTVAEFFFRIVFTLNNRWNWIYEQHFDYNQIGAMRTVRNTKNTVIYVLIIPYRIGNTGIILRSTNRACIRPYL